MWIACSVEESPIPLKCPIVERTLVLEVETVERHWSQPWCLPRLQVLFLTESSQPHVRLGVPFTNVGERRTPGKVCADS
jgi:hypothetical protein